MTLNLRGPAAGAYVPPGRVSTLPSQAATARTYDQRLNLYNLKPSHFRKTRAKLAAAEVGGLANIACLGDSITAGQGATMSTESWPVVMRNLLTASGVLTSNGTGIVLSNNGDSGFDPRTSRTGSWTKFVNGSDRTVLTYATGGSTYTFTSDVAGTDVDVYYSNASGSFTVAIDGGTAVAVTGAGGTTIGKYTVAGLSNTTHTVVVTLTTGTTYLAGFRVRKGTTGLRVSSLGLGGARTSDLIAGSQPFGVLSMATTDAPDLAVLALMTNEAFTSTSAASFKTGVLSLVTTLKAAGADVLLVAEIPANGQDLTPYRTVLYEAAIDQDVPVLDMFDRWGSWATANTLGQMFDAFHCTAAGYRDYARAVRDVIRPA